MDQQFMRKRKESEIAFAAKKDESGEFIVVKKHRPSGRQRVITEGLTSSVAHKIRNALIESSEE
jgi:hypothetical protein